MTETLVRPPAATRPAPMMGTRDLIVLYVTSLIGAGILVIPGITAQLAGPASLLAWGVLAAGSFAMAHMFANLATLNPDAGGLCTLIGVSLGQRFGDTALLVLVSVYMIGNPIMGVISGRYLTQLLGVGSGWVLPAGAAFMLLSVGFNLLGVKVGVRIQRIAFFALLACLGAAIAYAAPSMSLARFTPIAPHGWAPIGSAAVIAFFAFLGWENVLLVAGDVRNPRRAFRSAIAVAVPVVGLVYLGTTAAYLAVPAARETIVLPALLGNGLGRVSIVIADLMALAVLIVATNSWVFGASRVLMSAARRGLLPRGLAATRAGTGAPARALLVLAVAYTAVVAVMALFGLDEKPMLQFTSATFLVLYIPVAVAALRGRPSRALRVSAIATVALVVCFLPSTAIALPGVLALLVLMWLAAGRGSAAGLPRAARQALAARAAAQPISPTNAREQIP
jgi:amino acid efflux transporter